MSQTPMTSSAQHAVSGTHTVLKNTYMLLSMTLFFSALMAYVGMQYPTPMHPLLMIVGMMGLLFLVQKTQDSAMGIVSAFAFTGFMGFSLGPLLHLAVAHFANGMELITTALAATGFVFLGLSSYVLTTQRDFSFMGGLLFAMVLVAFGLSLVGLFFHAPALQLIVSGVFALISSGLIMFHTSEIIHGGERNYIAATVSLYVALFNLFVSLLQLFMAFAGDRE